ncbi:MAG: hypothetical protein JXA13_16125 [Anaerolineales bacterium]|nr:hypothetical protein [Anaerolineales bacterium]
MYEKRRYIIFLIIGILLFCTCCSCLLPLPVTCGALGASCAAGPDAQGYVHYYNELEPAGIAVLEIILHTQIDINYHSWYTREYFGAPPMP